MLPSPAPNVLLSPVGLTWKVYGNDPIDASGGMSSVLTARHSAGKPEAWIAVEETLDNMEAANQVIHREGRIHSSRGLPIRSGEYAPRILA